jgi:hypothetical protein
MMIAVKAPGRIFYPSRFLFPTLSVYNSFVPLMAMPNAEVLTNGEDKILSYTLMMESGNYSTCRDYEAFCNFIKGEAQYDGFLADDVNPIKREYNAYLRKRGLENTYWARTGELYFDDPQTNLPIPLLTMCVKQDAMFSIRPNNLTSEHLCLIVNKNFATQHLTLYRNVRKNYIDLVEVDGVDILYTNNILQTLYNDRGLKTPHFATVDELFEYAKSLNTIIHAAISSGIEPQYGANGAAII